MNIGIVGLFLQNVTEDLYQILQYEIISGIRLWTVFFYCLLATSFYSVFTRR